MNLDDYNKCMLTSTLLSCIKSGALDFAIQSEDCQDIINANLELKIAINERLAILTDKAD